ncbi:MAG: sensor histidine kinase [Fidelibacterota bacterium]
MKDQHSIHFALLTDETGNIRKILRDDHALVSENLTYLGELAEDKTRLSHFFYEIAYHGAAVIRDISLRNTPMTVQLIGAKTESGLTIICTAENAVLLDYIQDLTSMNSVQTETIRHQSKLLSKKNFNEDDLLNHFSQLNNNLVDLQRKLVKKNEVLMRLTLQMNTVFESAGLGFVFLKKDGKIDTFNAMGTDFFHRITGQTIQAGMSILDLVVPDSSEGIQALLARSLEGDFASTDVYADGWFEIRTTAVKDDSGNQKGVLLISEEISRRKNYEKTIESQKEFLHLMNKILRHDLANIFTITKSATSLYKRTSNEEMLDSIVEASDRGIRMIDRMKNAEKILHDPDKLRPVSLEGAVYRVMKDYKNLSFTCHGQGCIYADDLIYSLLNNLVSNAIRHGKATDMMFEISGEGDAMVLKVANNGKPIPDEIRDKVFEENFKFGETAQTGLGLFIVQKTTLRYGGVVKVESCKEWNTCFIFTFPKITEPEKTFKSENCE